MQSFSKHAEEKGNFSRLPILIYEFTFSGTRGVVHYLLKTFSKIHHFIYFIIIILVMFGT